MRGPGSARTATAAGAFARGALGLALIMPVAARGAAADPGPARRSTPAGPVPVAGPAGAAAAGVPQPGETPAAPARSVRTR